MPALDEELTAALSWARTSHDVLPFLEALFPVAEARFSLVPDDLLAFLQCQPEFCELQPGEPPRLMQFAGDYGTVGGMMLYRSRWDQHYYLAMPET